MSRPVSGGGFEVTLEHDCSEGKTWRDFPTDIRWPLSRRSLIFSGASAGQRPVADPRGSENQAGR